MSTRFVFFASLLATALLASNRAEACAVCGAGDPTLTVMGAERPFEGRMRASADLRVGSSAIGFDPGAIHLTEERLDLGFAYFPTRDLALSITLPGLLREVHQAPRSETLTSLGDVELRARDAVYTARKGPYKHQVSFFAGTKLPTAPLQHDTLGAYLPADLQPGCSSIVPFVGAAYTLGRGPWSLYASATLLTPFSVRDGPHTGDSLRSALTLQAQPMPKLAAQLGFSTRLDEPGSFNGVTDPNSGGFLGYVSTMLVVSPVTDVLLTAGAYFPAIQVLNGTHREGPIAQAGVTVDF